MTNEVNRIQINTNYQLNGIGNKPEEKENKAEEKKANVENTAVPAEDVLTYMNSQSMAVRPKDTARVLDISKYVTPEQAARIGGFISQFEDAVTSGLKEIENELGPNVMSDDAKLDLAVEMFKAANM